VGQPAPGPRRQSVGVPADSHALASVATGHSKPATA
jgi:hypothetical protein